MDQFETAMRNTPFLNVPEWEVGDYNQEGYRVLESLILDLDQFGAIRFFLNDYGIDFVEENNAIRLDSKYCEEERVRFKIEGCGWKQGFFGRPLDGADKLAEDLESAHISGYYWGESLRKQVLENACLVMYAHNKEDSKMLAYAFCMEQGYDLLYGAQVYAYQPVLDTSLKFSAIRNSPMYLGWRDGLFQRVLGQIDTELRLEYDSWYAKGDLFRKRIKQELR